MTNYKLYKFTCAYDDNDQIECTQDDCGDSWVRITINEHDQEGERTVYLTVDDANALITALSEIIKKIKEES